MNTSNATDPIVTIDATDVAASPDPITIRVDPSATGAAGFVEDTTPSRRRPSSEIKAKKKAARKRARKARRRNR